MLPLVVVVENLRLTLNSYCVGPSSEEYHVQTTPTQTTDIPSEFTGCHAHGEGELFVPSFLY